MDDATQHNQTQLTIHRRNARHLMQQAAIYGGEEMARVDIMNQLHDLRATIVTLKASLRAAGVVVVDAPEDVAPGQPDGLSVQARLDTMPLDVVPDPAPFPAFSRMPYSPNPYFVGRDDTLLALAQALKGGGRVALGPRAAATGLGGIGKTSVAAEFVHRYGQYFAGGVFWVSCADPAAVAGEVAACGGPGFLALYTASSDLKLDEQVALVMAAWRQAIPRLLIFDNCEDLKLVEAWAPPTGGCRVLITSRRQRWPSGLRVQTQRLAVLARANSIALLQQLAPRLTDAEADAIATELGDLPLALQLAGSYLAQFERTKITTYLKELTSDVILKHPSLQGTHDDDVLLTAHDRHVGRTFLVSYRHLDSKHATDALALQLLARASCLAPGEPIPLDLLLATVDLDGESLAGQRALQRLLNLSFLTSEGEDVLLHRLVHAFVQAVVQDTAALAAVEEKIIRQAYAINEVGSARAMQPLLAHLRWMTRLIASRNDMTMAALATNLGYCLHGMGNYIESRLLLERALVIHEHVLGPDHPSTATILNNLAGLLFELGDYAGARPLVERALALREQALGPNHPQTISSLNNFAHLLHLMGDYVGARPLLERVLAITEQALGVNHPYTAQILNNLASLLQTTGDYAGARLLYERALALREKVLGLDHPETAQTMNNLATLYRAMENYARARSLLERALAIQEQALGSEHPSTAASLNTLAALLHDIGEYRAARPLYERSLAINEQALGSDHPHTAIVRDNLTALDVAVQESPGEDQEHLAEASDPDHNDTPPQA